MKKSPKKNDFTRRKFIQKSSKLFSAMILSSIPPYGFAKKKFSIRVLGTHVTLQEALRLQAQQDLGIEVHFEPGGSAQVLHKASTNPSRFDLYEQWSNSINILWTANAIQPIEKKRIRYWDQVNNLTKTGQLTENAKIGAGDVPHKLLYVQKNQTLSNLETDQISFLPYVHNADSFGYNSKLVQEGAPYETESWGWLLDPKYKGKVAIVNAPTIGVFDMALAAQANNLIQFKDIGNISRQELDKLFDIMTEKKRQGHFRGVWSSVPQSVEFMQNDGVVIESMFSPGVAALNGNNIPCIYAAPKEGYRAWHGVMCLSSNTHGETKDAAYEYMNWWLSGWPGAFIARQGYYISTPQLSKPFLSQDEWNYWYEGKPTLKPLKNTEGKISIAKGSIRRGGSYENRFNNIAVWNTVMDTYEYSLVKWKTFLNA